MKKLILFLLIFNILSLKSQEYFHIYGWGGNNYGQLGDGTTTNRTSPTKIGTDYLWKQIEVGSAHSLALKQDGTLWGWGYNLDGRIGNGTTSNILIPTQIGSDSDWKVVNAGEQFTIAQKNDNTLWSAGVNNFGQLGDGTASNKTTLSQLNSDTDWDEFSCGGFHVLALKTDGSLWAWGNNSYGQLGDGTTSTSLVPKQIGSDTDWEKVFAGRYFSYAIKTDGTLWGWGDNGQGQMGDGTTNSRSVPAQIGSDNDWVRLTTGGYHVLAVKSNGQLWGWGGGNAAQLSFTPDRFVPNQIGNYEFVAAGQDYSIGIKSDGTLWGWGRNHIGQLGAGFSGGNSATQLQSGSDTDWDTIVGPHWNFHNLALKVAPTYNISGRVTDRGIGLEGVSISIGLTSTSTNSNGYYTLSNIPEDDFTFNLSKNSFDFENSGTIINVNQDLTNVDFEATFITDLPNNGDGNGDDIPDYSQNNVETILDAYGNSYITIASQDNFNLNEVSASFPEDNSFTYPFGKTEFKINASQAEVKIYYHGISSLDGYTYRKLLPNDTYGQFDNVTFSTEIINGNEVAVATLNLVDGGAGDYDGVVNGVIYDPGGPSLPVSANIPFWDWWWVLVLVAFVVYGYKLFG